MATKPLEFNTGQNGFCVARPGGKYAVLFNGLHIKTESNIIPRPNNNQDVIWLDMSANGKIAGTSQQVANLAWEWDGTWKSKSCYSVPRCCIYKPDNSLVVVTNAEQTGSLGYIQVNDAGQLVKTIDHFHDPVTGIYEYIIRGNVTVGHGGKSSLGENPLICIVDGIVRLLERGNCLASKFYRDGENCAIAWINGSLSKVWFTTVAELKTFPVYNPNPEPEPPEPPVPNPNPNGLEIVKRNRVKYNDLGAGPKRAWTVTNASAWDMRNDGAGMFFKDSGTEYNDRNINCILFKHRPGVDPSGKGEMYDVLRDAEGIAEPRWGRTNPSGYGDITKWRAPVEPESSQPPNPIPTNPDRDMLIHIRDEINEFLGET